MYIHAVRNVKSTMDTIYFPTITYESFGVTMCEQAWNIFELNFKTIRVVAHKHYAGHLKKNNFRHVFTFD